MKELPLYQYNKQLEIPKRAKCPTKIISTAVDHIRNCKNSCTLSAKHQTKGAFRVHTAVKRTT
jgi:hypothetical protein